MNDLIVNPQFTRNVLKLAINTTLLVNDVQRSISDNSMRIAYKSWPQKYFMEEIKFYSQFVFLEIDIINNITKYNKHLQLHRFIKRSSDEWNFTRDEKRLDCDGTVTYYYKVLVDYYEINESFINYLGAKGNLVKIKNEISRLKSLFQDKNTLEWDEYLDQKSKYLINLNLNYLTEPIKEKKRNYPKSKIKTTKPMLLRLFNNVLNHKLGTIKQLKSANYSDKILDKHYKEIRLIKKRIEELEEK